MHRSSTDKRHFIIVGVLTIISTIFMTILLRSSLPLPPRASTQASTIDFVFDVHMFLIALFFSLVMVFVLYSAVVFRRRAGDEQPGEHFEGNSLLEIVWTVVPLIIVFGLMGLGVVTLNNVTKAADNEMVVNIEGRQWSWVFEYPDAGVVSYTEMVLPVDQPIRMEMTATDVLHSFWVPAFRVKQDLVPGRTTIVRVTPSEEGDYALRCAELCGLSHWSMVVPVRVVTTAEYEQWLSEQAAIPTDELVDAAVDVTD